MKSENRRGPTMTQLFDIIMDARNQIKHSFVVCGQGEQFEPDEILYIKKRKSCLEECAKLKWLLSYLPKGWRRSIFREQEDEYNNFVDVDDDRSMRWSIMY